MNSVAVPIERDAPVAGAGPAGDFAGVRPWPGHCRFCGQRLGQTFVDLGPQPLCESYLAAADLGKMEPFYSLHAFVCGRCFLVQVDHQVRAEDIYSDYAYFSSYSDSWLRHAEAYVEAASRRFGLGPRSRVVEVASNDGYLLQYFVRRGVPVLGIEPAANVAAVAAAKGVPSLVRFFGRQTAADVAASHGQADLLIGNNVLAHVPDLNDFVAGLATLLAPAGVVTMEFPHLVKLVAGNQFDTIYHEHYSYLSFTVARRVFAAHGLEVFDVEELATHGGSLRLYAHHAGDATHAPTPRVAELLGREAWAGVLTGGYYASFTEQVKRTKRKLLAFLIAAREAGKTVVGYGAPGKGNTLLNYCGIRTDLLDYTVDRSPHKQGKFLPGTRIPIHAPGRIAETRPDYVLILPWNLKDEIMAQMARVREWGGKFVVPIPEVVSSQ